MSNFTELLDKYIAAKMTEQTGSYVLQLAESELNQAIVDLELDGIESKTILKEFKDILMRSPI